jgi:hypothetical protein
MTGNSRGLATESQPERSATDATSTIKTLSKEPSRIQPKGLAAIDPSIDGLLHHIPFISAAMLLQR